MWWEIQGGYESHLNREPDNGKNIQRIKGNSTHVIMLPLKNGGNSPLSLRTKPVNVDRGKNELRNEGKQGLAHTLNPGPLRTGTGGGNSASLGPLGTGTRGGNAAGTSIWS